MAASAYLAPAAEHRAVAEINITPLVDVMLVLLVIFMMATPMLDRPLPLTLQQEGPSTPTVRPPLATLGVGSGGAYTLDGRVIAAGGLAEELSALADAAPATVLAIDAAADADYQSFATALGTARASGLQNIALPR